MRHAPVKGKGRRTGKAVKINRQKRRVLHAIWPSLVMNPLNKVYSDIEYNTRLAVFGEGLTDKEREYIRERCYTIRKANEDLAKIYFRLKS